MIICFLARNAVVGFRCRSLKCTLENSLTNSLNPTSIPSGKQMKKIKAKEEDAELTAGQIRYPSYLTHKRLPPPSRATIGP